MKKNTPELTELRHKMSQHFDLAFGQTLSDEEHEFHFGEYMSYRKKYEALIKSMKEKK